MWWKKSISIDKNLSKSILSVSIMYLSLPRNVNYWHFMNHKLVFHIWTLFGCLCYVIKVNFLFFILQDTTDGRILFSLSSRSYTEMATSPTDSQRISPATSPQSTTNVAYRPIYKHWFFSKISEAKVVWTPFSMADSMNLEEAFIAKSTYLDFIITIVARKIN